LYEGRKSGSLVPSPAGEVYEHMVSTTSRIPQRELMDRHPYFRMLNKLGFLLRGHAYGGDAEEVRIPPTDQGSTDQDQMWQRWREIQSTFVDDPRNAVTQAHALVSGVIDRVVQQLQDQRGQLERGWSSGDNTSTEDLRRGLQSYREFLTRLLSRDDIPKA